MRIKSEGPYWLLYAAVVTAGLYYAHGTRLIFNLDALSYLSIARLYANGDWAKALNTIWSPLFSWLLALLYAIGADPLYWGKVLIAASIVPSLLALRLLNRRLNVHPRLAFFVTATAAVVLLQSAVYNFTPDVLAVAPTFWMLHLVLTPSGWSTRNALALGAVAALGYYAKHFGLAYFLLVFGATVVVEFAFATSAVQRKALLRHAVYAVSFFALLLLPWAVALSFKKGKPTITETPAYNVSLYANPAEDAHPYNEYGLLPLPYPEAFTYFDDPTLLPVPPFTWKQAFATPELARFQIARMKANCDTFYDIVNYLLGNMLVPLCAAFCAALCFLLTRRTDTRLRDYGFLFFSATAYAGLYVLVLVDYRYTYFALVLVLVATGKMLSDGLTAAKVPTWLYALVGLAFLFQFGKTSFEKTNEIYVKGSVRNAPFERMAKPLTPRAVCCSVGAKEFPRELIFLANLRYVGKLRDNAPLAETDAALNRFGVRYVFAPAAVPDSMLTLLRPLHENDHGVWIYETNALRNPR